MEIRTHVDIISIANRAEVVEPSRRPWAVGHFRKTSLSLLQESQADAHIQLSVVQACLNSPGDGPPYRQTLPNWLPAASPRRHVLTKLLTYITLARLPSGAIPVRRKSTAPSAKPTM